MDWPVFFTCAQYAPLRSTQGMPCRSNMSVLNFSMPSWHTRAISALLCACMAAICRCAAAICGSWNVCALQVPASFPA